MIHLIYVSDFARELNQQDFDDILTVSTKNNYEQDITGFLVVNGQNFFQVLEGSEEQVYTLLESIRRDPRHQNLRVIISEIIEKRDYPKWSMGFVCNWHDYFSEDIKSVLIQYGKTQVFNLNHGKGLRGLLQGLG
ncbi:BLUF domain-containing protein [Aliiglaciecola sp. 2_MG-2023]|uniref:BLUF domain-containing protein n=1 Tax=unclassified Aliiglaciecola TaxID=2593648 RepID=UPI0026E2C00A|nr:MULTISPECIES: BLUF domain-containing protein [unclassified Aliiglaciecola]MDO6713209.1 BLUF domain-containing protein [Aliiglaciecola sp. 2_MG-2023]MDO6754305.1 BLUF domain-containing protein [Aliiglaciecola sp. 1_MG-2023]